ncbi:hypothetical protein Cgig2_002194 [Carnegiea gigantea]|uniref:non-specific serine/threonine protein kinase n=1 Tax=Carnegiea gigantea TaxID=171969 RepID=A0A9Q1QQK3_9CARY|nr:hypothetical protein Cgig2_002194 [Carnegiea gigantea]
MSLIHVIFNNNQLTGSIPDTLGLVLTLEVIRLDANSLSGAVPKNLNILTRAAELNLGNNNLSGQIPDLTGMNVLTYVDLSNNSFDRSGIPEWFKTLPNLTTLIMVNTGLEGPIPTEIFNLPQLQTVILRDNHLNGTLDIGMSFSSDLQLIDLQNNSIDGFNSGQYRNKTLLDDNPFCRKPEAAEICKTVQAPMFSNFVPQQYCAPLSCFLDLELGPDCSRPYLGSLVFRSFNFSDLANLFYYNFLVNSLQPLLANVSMPVDKVCLVSSSIDMYSYLVLNIAFFPLDGAYFNRTGISTIGHVLNNQFLVSPYGPYYFIDLSYPSFPGQRKHTGLIIGLTIGGFVLALLTIAAGVYAYRQGNVAKKATKLSNPFSSWNEGSHPQLNAARWFSFEEVKHFTDNFSGRSEIGSGGYGKVYKGKLNTGQLVAIKRAKQGSLQGALEFKTEIELLSRVHHKNVVNLVGFCYDEGEQMLIYEYVTNGSLKATLSGKSGIWLNWPTRLNIALGAARGLAYLHELADPPIIHRDIKSDNILLDDQLNAKVADFGLCKPLSDNRGHVTTQVKGTMGYLDPEYYNTQMLTEKSDVYSFGVLMLELVTGKNPIEQNGYIVTKVKGALEETGNIYNLVDDAISFDMLTGVMEFVKLAIHCVQDRRDRRPAMSKVVKDIESIIQELKGHLGSTTSSAGYEGSGNVHPYSSSSSSFGITGNNPLRR